MNKHLLLKAEKYNWGLHCDDDWESVEWLIYDNRSYVVNIRFGTGDSERIITAKTRYLRRARFGALVEAMKNDWIDPSIWSDGCDGVAWEFRMYATDGELLKTSGEEGYIYGQKVLERIADLLPGQAEIKSHWAYLF